MAVVAHGLGDAVAGLQAAEGEVANILQAALRDVGEAALDHFRQSWPVDTGLSLSTWRFEQVGANDGTLYNNTEYTSFVHEGLSDRLWHDVTRAVERDVRLLLSERVVNLIERGRG